MLSFSNPDDFSRERVYTPAMKTNLWPCLLAGACLVCSAADPIPSDQFPGSWIDPTDPTIAPLRQAGERLIDRVGQMLIYEVEHTVAEKGVAKAMELAHLKDLTLPKSVPGQPRVTAIKRTSLQLRSPANQPDLGDQAALEAIDTALRDGDDVPNLLIQRLDRPGDPTEWRVYRPLVAVPICLKCHGPLENLKPEVRSLLTQKFPADQATGYTAYKWRGLIRVSLAAPETAAPAKSQ